MNTYAVDTETFYSKDVGIKTLGTYKYVSHPEAKCYLVSIYGPGVEYCGAPENAPWDKIDGARWVSHNRSFDEAVFEAQKLTRAKPAVWECTADMVAFLQAPRDLAGASKELLGVSVSKDVRAKLKGKHWSSMDDAFRAEAVTYAMDDAKHCLALWEKFSDQWPEHERWLSRHTTHMGARGIGVDRPLVDQQIEVLQQALFKAEEKIPWDGATLSPKELAKECRKIGIPPPASTAKDSPEFELWADEYAEAAPFVAAMRDFRRTNRTLQVLLAIRDRSFGSVMPYNLKYGGAQHTMRWSGSAGLNLQNLPRAPYKSDYADEAVDLRACLCPPPGFSFVSSDLSQIEARVLLWLAQDERTLELIRQGMCIYEAYARLNMGYSDPKPLKKAAESDPSLNQLRQLCKALRLGLGFGMGAAKFPEAAKKLANVTVGVVEAERLVEQFRKQNPGITTLWRNLGRSMQRRGDNFIELPSGSRIWYFDTYSDSYDWRARVVRGGPAYKFFPGKWCENLVQRVAREVLASFIPQIEPSCPIVLHVHDELLACVPTEQAEEAKRFMESVMSKAPDWAPGLPVATDPKILTRYGK